MANKKTNTQRKSDVLLISSGEFNFTFVCPFS